MEVTTLRLDQETDGRHACVRFTDDWRADAARRDFTFNALMLDMDGGLHDYFHGQADLALGHVRFIGKPQIAWLKTGCAACGICGFGALWPNTA